jgi:YVTN family beta-propeller protein
LHLPALTRRKTNSLGGASIALVIGAATTSNTVAVINPESLLVTARIPGGDHPDGLAYVPPVGKLCVSDEHRATDIGVPVLREMFLQTLPEPDD